MSCWNVRVSIGEIAYRFSSKGGIFPGTPLLVPIRYQCPCPSILLLIIFCCYPDSAVDCDAYIASAAMLRLGLPLGVRSCVLPYKQVKDVCLSPRCSCSAVICFIPHLPTWPRKFGSRERPCAPCSCGQKTLKSRSVRNVPMPPPNIFRPSFAFPHHSGEPVTPVIPFWRCPPISRTNSRPSSTFLSSLQT